MSSKEGSLIITYNLLKPL